jgi:dipeptidase
MCDTLCGPGAGGMVFAKNSDRPVGEVQLAVPFGRRPTAGCTLRTQYLSIGDTGAHAALLSCPTWLWGAEHGVNEFGVAIGNERVNTVHQAAQARPALIGMDMVRLALERARSAEEALAVLIDLLTTYGQGGIADAAHNEAYDSSFLIADAGAAFVLDTSGSNYAAAPFHRGTAVSNRLAVGSGWTQASPDLEPGDDFDRFRDQAAPTASADARLAASRAFLDTQRAAGTGLTAAATAAHLRDHGNGPWGAPGSGGSAQPPPTGHYADPAPAPAPANVPAPAVDAGARASVCMHAPQRSVTAASLITVLPPDLAAGAPLRAYVALGSPCVSIYVPAFLRTMAGASLFVPFELSSEVMWRAADTLRERVDADPGSIESIREVLDPVEEELWSEADDVVEHPDRWNEVGRSWGSRALGALQSCHP